MATCLPLSMVLNAAQDRDFGLPVAHVAADEPIRGLGLLQVRLRLDDRFHLVGRFLVRERRFELALPIGIGRERVAGHGLAKCLDLNHLGGHVANRFADAILAAAPRQAAELGQLRLGVRPSDIPLHEVDPRGRHVQEHTVAELEDQVFFEAHGGCRFVVFQCDLLIADGSLLQQAHAAEAADAVVDVNHVIAFV